jgi:membrane-associated phospholipid phosphatase
MLALPYALLISYTRIYLGVHFPGDILAGAIMGSLIGYFFGRISVRFLSLRATEKIQREPQRKKS